jgi:single-strand DNA-binding protein
MSTINMTQLIGNAAAKPEVRFLPNGSPVAKLRLATTEHWKDKSSGENMEHTEWHQVSLFGRQAEVAGDYIDKGDKIYIQGRLRTRKWSDKEGVDRYTTEIICDRMVMLGKKKSRPDDSGLLAEETEDDFMGDEVPF